MHESQKATKLRIQFGLIYTVNVWNVFAFKKITEYPTVSLGEQKKVRKQQKGGK